jgi:hypothetical protein
MILTCSTLALTGRFGSSSIIRDFLLSGQRQPVISPDNTGSTVFSTELGIRFSFIKTSKFQRGMGKFEPSKPPSVRHCPLYINFSIFTLSATKKYREMVDVDCSVCANTELVSWLYKRGQILQNIYKKLETENKNSFQCDIQ